MAGVGDGAKAWGRGAELPGPPRAPGPPYLHVSANPAALRTPSLGSHGGPRTQARLIESSAAGD